MHSFQSSNLGLFVKKWNRRIAFIKGLISRPTRSRELNRILNIFRNKRLTKVVLIDLVNATVRQIHLVRGVSWGNHMATFTHCPLFFFPFLGGSGFQRLARALKGRKRQSWILARNGRR